MSQPELTLSRETEETEGDSIDLLQIVQVLRRHWLPAGLTFGSIVTLAGVITFLQTPIYESRGQLLLQSQNQASALAGLSEKLGDLSPLSNQSNPLETEAQVIQSSPILEGVIATLNLRDSKGDVLLAEDLRKNIKVKTIRGTDVLEITYRDPEPDKAARLVNLLMQIYLQNNVQVNRAQSRAAREFIAQQLPRTNADLQRAESMLRRFKEANRVVDLKGEAMAAVTDLSKLKEFLAEAQAQYAEANVRSGQLRQQFGMTGAQAVAVGRLSESEGVQSTLKQLQNTENLLTTESQVYAPDHPRIVELSQKVAALKQAVQGRVVETLGAAAGNTRTAESSQMGKFGLDLTTELVKAEVEQRAAAERITSLQQIYQATQQRTTVLPRLEQQQLQLERNLEVARVTYQGLLKALQEAQLAENQNIGNARVVENAIAPRKPVSPKKALNLALGVLLGGLAGAGVALILNALDKTVLTVKDVRGLFDYVLLGTIPLLEGSQKRKYPKQFGEIEPTPQRQLIVRDKPRSSGSEAYRMLLANLKFASSDHPLQVIAVSSAMPSEGKSTTVANLALAMAELGARVLIIDADLRRSSQHRVWERPNFAGLSNVLVEQRKVSEVIHLEGDSLELMTSGVMPPNPVTLLDSQRMADLLQRLRAEYDYILIDCPPLLVAADALIISKMIDGLLMVARPGILMRPGAAVAREMLQQVKVAGLVVNGVMPEHESDSYYYYGYGAEHYYGSREDVPMESKALSKEVS